ncbi:MULTISPECIES: BspA family leucine-rich repeat surface protein [unclassified Enterococcus]|uniref:BspA family leucine-rich repeat surface protein n=1 Tax=unclassified Enterococcus TaxID=2608891 RepID=UPI0013EDB2D9|nr:MULTISPECIES: BspA family leucine-rich repeat surface protein [unclassified Enterococcus]
MRKTKYISILFFLFGHMMFYGEVVHADSDVGQHIASSMSRSFSTSDSTSKPLAEESPEMRTGVYKSISYILKNNELELTGITTGKIPTDIVIDNHFLDAIAPSIDKITFMPEFFYSIKGQAVRTFTVSSSLKVVPYVFEEPTAPVKWKNTFSGNHILEKVDFGDTDFSEMFADCTQLKSVWFNKLDAANLEGMFMGCTNLREITILQNTAPVNVTNMFKDCQNLTAIQGIDHWNTTEIKNKEGMFSGCTRLFEVDLDSWRDNRENFSVKAVGGEPNDDKKYGTKNDRAEFASSDWQFQLTPQKDKYILTKYVGRSTDIVVPTSINGKPTVLQDINTTVIPSYNTVTSFKIEPGSKVPIQDTDLRYAFQFWSALKEVDLTGLDTSAVTNTGAMFANDPSLVNVNLSGWDTSHVIDMNYMFNVSSQIQDLDLSGWDVTKVTNMAHMFAGLKKLKKLDLSSFRTDNVTNMNYMFGGTDELNLLNLSNFDMKNVQDMSKMFFSNNKQTPLLVIAKDNRLLNYDYYSDNRAVPGPVFDANGGVFQDQVTSKYYFQTIAVQPTDPKLQVQTFQDFKKGLVVKKEHSIFSGWIDGVENPTDVTTLTSTIYQASWLSLPNIPSSSDNISPESVSIYGLAYFPGKFFFPPILLKESGAQKIPFTKANSFHVGVCDKSNTDHTWTLQAQLVWENGGTLPGSKITTTNAGVVKKNSNDGTSPFNPITDLTDSTNEVQGASQPSIATTAPVIIMRANQVKHDAVYDYDFGDVALEIADTKSVKPGNYVGHVEWNLVNGPS